MGLTSSSIFCKFYPLKIIKRRLLVIPLNEYFASSEYPDEMQHNAAFHQGLHCFKRKMIFRQKNTIFCENYNMDCPKIIVSNQKNPFVYKGLRTLKVL